MKRWTVLALGVSLAACAGKTGGASERSYVRPQLPEVPLRRLDVVVVAANPIASPPHLDVAAFPPPKGGDPLRAAREDPDTVQALVVALRSRLKKAGFEVRFFHSLAASQAAAPPPEVAALPPASTSTAPVELPTVTVAPSAVRAAELPLDDEASLDSLRADSDADGLLVVRVVPVDAFYLFESQSQSQVVDPSAGMRQPLPDDSAELRSGRLLVGQAFLFDAKTGLRLWSRQLPDVPEDGRLRTDSRLLAYGVVRRPREPELMPRDKAKKASSAFVRAMLAGFPSPQDGSAGGRAALDAVDAELDLAREAFLDDTHVALELGLGWGGERAGATVLLDGNEVGSLDTGALAPNGLLRASPRLSYLAPGGFVGSLGLSFGLAPGGFSRSYHRDNPRPDLADPDHRSARVSIDGARTLGAEVTAGYAFLLSPTLFLVPSAGAFGDVWMLDARPGTAIPDGDHYRFGVLGRVDLLLRPSERGPFFTRTGASARFGHDTAGPSAFGFELSASVGLFL